MNDILLMTTQLNYNQVHRDTDHISRQFKTGPKCKRTINKRDLTKRTLNGTADNSDDNKIIPALPQPLRLTFGKSQRVQTSFKDVVIHFSNILISQQSNNKLDTILQDIRYFLNDQPCQHPKMSTIHYKELLNKNSDSDEND